MKKAYSIQEEDKHTVIITLSRLDAEFVARVLHTPFVGISGIDHKRALDIGNNIAKQLTREVAG